MTISDDLREDMIKELGLRFMAAKTSEERRELWGQIRILIRGRSAARVKQMEQERGLR